MGHHGKRLHLELSDDQKYVYIITEYDEDEGMDTDMKIWDIKEFKNVPLTRQFEGFLKEISIW